MGEICYFIELLNVTRQKLTVTKQGTLKADNSHVVQDVKGTYVRWGRKTLPSGYYTDITILVMTIF